MKSAWFWIVVILLSSFLFVFEAQKIQLVTLDLGRHIINGDIMLHPEKFGVTRYALLHTNLFSTTYPDFPFVNHHWGSGVLLYLIYNIGSWSGLSLAYIFWILLAFIILLFTIKDDAHPLDIFLGGLILLPLIGERIEVRPEGLSYLFFALFIFILYRFSRQKISARLLWILPFLQILWSNSHIYFIFGPCLILGFLIEALFQKRIQDTKKLGIIFICTLVACCLTPYGIPGLLYPFTIFQNYGYKVVENQSIYFLEHISFTNPNFLLFKIVSLASIAGVFLLALWRKWNMPIALSGIAFVFGVMAFLGIRHFTLFAFALLPLSVLCIHEIRIRLLSKFDKEMLIALYSLLTFCTILFICIHFSNRIWTGRNGLGLAPQVMDSATFVKEHGLSGPIFSNYDIGGYIIFNFFPKEKVFVDNRPEAYPASFFEEVYVPMQTNDNLWNTVSAEQHFNMIYFYRLDMTPWAQAFLINRIQDPSWAAVYVDAYTIIFLKRNPENAAIIKAFELPQSMFSTHS